MSTDIVNRLRLTDPEAEALGIPELERRSWEAAEEIERLRALVDEYQKAGEAWLAGLGESPWPIPWGTRVKRNFDGEFGVIVGVTPQHQPVVMWHRAGAIRYLNSGTEYDDVTLYDDSDDPQPVGNWPLRDDDGVTSFGMHAAALRETR